MNRCSVKDKLNQYRYIDAEAKQLKEQIEELRERITSVQSPRLDAIPCNTNNTDNMQKLIEKLVDLEEIYKQKLLSLAEEQKAIEEIINGFDKESRIMLRKRYIEGKKWETICVEMHSGWDRTHRMHHRCLEKLKKKNKNRTKSYTNK